MAPLNEEAILNVTETKYVSDNIKDTLATFDDDKVSPPAWRATEDHTL